MRSGWRCRVPGTGRTAEGCRSFRRLRFLSGKLCNQSIALEVLRLEPLASNSGHAFGRKIRECGHRGHRITRFSCAISLKFKLKFKLFSESADTGSEREALPGSDLPVGRGRGGESVTQWPAETSFHVDRDPPGRPAWTDTRDPLRSVPFGLHHAAH